MKKLLLLFVSLFALASVYAKPMGEKEWQAFLHQFPFDHYSIVNVQGQGKFYIDPIDDCIKGFLRSGNVWEPHIVRLLTKYIKRGSTVIDIGAHIGTHTVMMAKLAGKRGKVIAFEPQPKSFRELFWNCKLNNVDSIVELHRCALGPSEGIARIKPGPLGNEGHAEIAAISEAVGDEVEMKTLDSFNFSNVSLMKIDVENFEEELLRGARQTILTNRPVIIIEILGGSWFIYENTTDELKQQIEHVRRIVVDLGYDVQRIYGCDFLAIPK